MASVQDRWFVGKTPTARNGTGLRWRATYRTLEGKQRSRSFARKVDAERFLTTVESTKLSGTFVDPARGRVTVDATAKSWTAAKVGLKASTRSVYASILEEHVLPRWRDVPLTAVEHEAIQEWVASMVKAGASGALVNKIVGVFSAVLDVAVRNKRLVVNPARGVKLPTADSKPKRYLTVAQVETLANAAAVVPPDQPKRATNASYGQYRLVVLVLAYCGLRWSEMAALRVASVDLVRRRISVSAAVVEVDGTVVWGTPKSGETRSVPIPGFLLEELRAHVDGKDPADLLFTSPGGGVLRNRNARRAWFDDAATTAGVNGLTPHELRHTAVSLAVSAGANVMAVQRMVGHANPAITLKVYADLFDTDLDAVATALDELRAKAGVAPALPDVGTDQVKDPPELAVGQ